VSEASRGEAVNGDGSLKHTGRGIAAGEVAHFLVIATRDLSY
jgi:hypothetical protein